MSTNSNELAALRDIEQRLYDTLRSGPGGLLRIPIHVSPEMLRYAIACLAQFQEDMMALMSTHGIEPLSGEELESGKEKL